MQVVAIIAAVVGLVWGGVVLLRGGLLGGCLMVLLAGTCFSLPFLDLEVGTVSLTVDRILWVVLIAQYALWRRWGWADPKPLTKAEWVLFGLFGVLLLRTFTADWRVDGSDPAILLGICYLMPLGVYWVARQSKLSERGVLAIFGCLAVFGAYLAVATIAEVSQMWWLVYPKYVERTITSAELEFIGRGRGPLLHPIGNGMLLSVCLIGALMWWPRLKPPGRIVLMLFSLPFLLAIYYTLTRSVWMGGMLGLAIVAGVTIPRGWRAAILGGGLLTAVLVAASQWEHVVAFKRDRNLTARETAESVHMRPILAAVAWKMFLDRPLAGCGFAQYTRQSAKYVSDRSTGLPLEKARGYDPHNVFLSLLTETGLPGMMLFVVLLGLWGRDAWRLWRLRSAPLWARQQGLLFLAALGVYVINGMFHDMSLIPMAHMTLFFLAGVTAGLRPQLQPVPDEGSRLTAPREHRV